MMVHAVMVFHKGLISLAFSSDVGGLCTYLISLYIILVEHLPAHLGNKLVKNRFPRRLDWQR